MYNTGFLRLLPMLIWRLSASLMSNGATLAKTGGVLAYTFGSRTDQTCRKLLALLTPFNIGMLTSDDLGSYGRVVPKNKHLTGKIFP